MEKHLLPLLYSMVALVGGSVIDDNSDPQGPKDTRLYTLLLKLILWGMALGWAVALGLGIFTIHKFSQWSENLDSMAKLVLVLNERQQSNIKCLVEIKDWQRGYDRAQKGK